MNRLVKFLLAVSFIVFACMAVQAQKTIVSGVVSDADTKEKLPFVTIYFTNSTTGVTSDLYGAFKLETKDQSLTSVTIAYLGYNNKNVIITPGEEQTITVELLSTTAKLDVVEITGARKVKKDSAAIVLYRNVIKNKPINSPENLDYYSFEEYAKTEFDIYNISEKFKKRKVLKPFDFVFENTDTSDTGVEFLPILLKETITDHYYAKDPTRKKEITRANQFSGIENMSAAGLLDFTFDEVDIYSNIILVGGKSFISPFSNTALTTYKYFLEDSSMVDDLWCYKLVFTGKRKGDPAFSGHAWVHDKTFAVKSIEIYILPNININFINDFGVRQNFVRRDDKHWFKNDEYIYTSINRSQDKEKQSFMIKRTTSRDKIKINKPIKEKVFGGPPKENSIDAEDKDDEYWVTARHEDLSRQESAVYTTIDSVKSTKAYKRLNWLGYLASTAYFRAGPVEFGRFYKFFSWNAIEGKRIRLGARTSYKFSKRIQFDGYGAYGLKDKSWKYHGGFRANLGSQGGLWSSLVGFYKYDMAQLNVNDPLITHDNFILSILRRDPLEDLLKTRQVYGYYEKELVKDLTQKVTFNHRIFYSVDNGYVFRRPDPTDTLGTRINDFTSTEIEFNTYWGPGQKWFESFFGRIPLSFHKPVFDFTYTAGLKGVLGGDYGYHKLQLHIRHNWGNFLGNTKYQAFAGKTFGDAPYPLLRMHQGNESFVFNRFSFNMLGEFEYVSDQYAAFWVNHHFGGLIMNRIPLIKKLKLRSMISYKFLVGSMKESNENEILLQGGLQPLNDYYMEVGFGIENIFKVIRVEALWRVTQRDKPDVMKWGIRLALSPSI